MSEATLAYRRLLDRFGKPTEKLGHLHHSGEIRSSVKDGTRTVELKCECGALLGPLARYLTALLFLELSAEALLLSGQTRVFRFGR